MKRNPHEMSSREPLAIRAAVVAALAAAVNLAVAFGLPWSVDQVAAALGFVNVASIAVVVVWSRGAITPVADPRDSNGTPLTPDATDY